jgi:hypothetical protein
MNLIGGQPHKKGQVEVLMRIRRQHPMDGLAKPDLVAGEIECGQPEA